MEEKTEVNDDYIICPFLHRARPGIAFRSSGLSSNIFFVLDCTGLKTLDKSHEWHEGFRWERDENKQKQQRKRKETEDAKRIRISQSSN